MFLTAICLSDTFVVGDKCSVTTKVRKEGSQINLRVFKHDSYDCGYTAAMVKYCPLFDTPLRLTGNSRYIIEVLMNSNKRFKRLERGFLYGYYTLSDNSKTIRVYYYTVSAAELADSNGSTQSEGGINGILGKFV